MIDAHCHLHDPKYDGDRDAVVARAREGGVAAMITIGTSVDESARAVATAGRYDSVYATVGLHPHVFNDGGLRREEWRDDVGFGEDEVARLGALAEAVDALDALAASPLVVAVGEVGLDYHVRPGVATLPEAVRVWQRQGLRMQLAMARRRGLPVVVHGRPSAGTMDAYDDLVAIVADHPDLRFVMHCYMGDTAVTAALLALPNVVFSFAGNVTYAKKSDDAANRVIAMIPSNRLMLETDAPYLAPVPMRGTRNEPAYVSFIAAYVARVRATDATTVITNADAVTRAFFALP